ncbi:uncharacterized protein TNCV_4362011 [Trichonephila clavipes]|nr:uncharacterized protein TNCV_4362011 [Trichonephila clavipes]
MAERFHALRSVRSLLLSELGGRGSRVVWISDRGLPGHEFDPSTTKDPPCRAAMHNSRSVKGGAFLSQSTCVNGGSNPTSDNDTFYGQIFTSLKLNVRKCSGTCQESRAVNNYIHWCAKIKDEVEKLAYQLNEEAEWTESPIRRLSKVMYGSTCADMQVDVMGECLSSIKHVVGVRSVFLAKRLYAV